MYFYRTNMGDNPMFSWRIGIQVYYLVDGVRNHSDIVYPEVYDHPVEEPGDVNHDGSVDIADVTDLIDYLLSPATSEVDEAYADVNEDGEVNIVDVTDLIDLLLGSN